LSPDPDSDHGGHSDPDASVLQDADCTTTCHSYTTTGIHDTTTPVQTIHGGNCGWCHLSPSGGGDLISPLQGLLGDGPQGCTDCHGFSAGTEAAKIAGHHNYTKIADSSDGRARSGLCVDCHIANVNQDGALDMPANLPCNFCHLYFPEGPGYQQTGGKNNIYALTWTPAAGGGTFNAAVSTSHTISATTGTTPPISNYQACFACHGASSYNGAPPTTPFHGQGTPYTGDDTTGGNANDILNAYMNPQTSGTTSVIKSIGIHPGPINFNAIGSDVMGVTKTKPYANDTSPGFHKSDLGNHTRADALDNRGDFTVPWDNFVPGVGSGSISITHKLAGASSTVNTNVTPTIPLVPLYYTAP